MPHHRLILVAVALGLLHCGGGTPDDSALGSEGSASTINGGGTGAFDREVTGTGFTAIDSSVRVPDYNAPTDGSKGEPFIYYIFSDDYGNVAMEAGLSFQHGDSSKPHRWLPYLRGAGPGNDNSMQFAGESSAVAPNTTIDMAATFDGQTVRLKINGTIVATENLVGLSPGNTHAARVVGNAVSGRYQGEQLGSVFVTFDNTTVWDTGGSSHAFDSVKGWSTSRGGVAFGTVQWPAKWVSVYSTGTSDVVSICNGRCKVH